MNWNLNPAPGYGVAWYRYLKDKADKEAADKERQKRDAQREKEEKYQTANIPLTTDAVIAQTLPKYVIIQSSQNHRYLLLDAENPNAAEAVRFFGEYSFELDTRFEVVPDHTTGDGLIRIRCLHNNKFLANSGTHNNYIAAIADKPDSSCTLFQPILVYSNNNSDLKLRHYSTGLFVQFCQSGGDDLGLLSLMTGNRDDHVCTFLDWESVVALPDLIMIKSSRNGNHLQAFEDGFMDYNSKSDDSSKFVFQVFPSRNGGIRLKSDRYDTYWTDIGDREWVWLQNPASTTIHETDTVFIPTRIGADDNRIVMRCLKNGLFCNEHSASSWNGYRDVGKQSCLATLNTYIDDWSIMEIEEPVQSRTVNNVRYGDVRLYDESSNALVTDETSNTTQFPLTSVFNLKTTVTNKHSWNTGWKFGLGGKMKFTAGVPLIGDTGFEISADYTMDRDSGEEDAKTTEVGKVITVIIPPMTRVVGNLIATRFKYEIPFTYSQHDFLKDGTPVTYRNKVGLLTGVNGNGYDTDIKGYGLQPSKVSSVSQEPDSHIGGQQIESPLTSLVIL